MKNKSVILETLKEGLPAVFPAAVAFLILAGVIGCTHPRVDRAVAVAPQASLTGN